jgi:hypothetical protein
MGHAWVLQVLLFTCMADEHMTLKWTQLGVLDDIQAATAVP